MKNIPTTVLGALSVPVVLNRSVVDTALAFYNYFIAPDIADAPGSDPIIAWITSTDSSVIELISNLTGCTVVPINSSQTVTTDARAARLARRGATGPATSVGAPVVNSIESLKPGTPYHNRGVYLFFADPLPQGDVSAINELETRQKLVDDIDPIKLCTAFRSYRPGIRTGDDMLPDRYVEFYAGAFFKPPFDSKSLDVILMSSGARPELVAHDWYELTMKMMYHHSTSRVINRYPNPFSGNFGAFVIQTAQFYDEYGSRWDSIAELQILKDLALTNGAIDSIADEVAALSAVITAVLGPKSSPHIAYAQLMSASFEAKKTKQNRRGDRRVV